LEGEQMRRAIGSVVLLGVLAGCSRGGGSSTSDALSLVSGRAIAYPSIQDDEIVIAFSAEVAAASARDLSHYSFECPVGTPLPLAGTQVLVSERAREVRLRLSQSGTAAVNLPVGSSFRIVVRSVTSRSGAPLTGTGTAAGVVEGTNAEPSLAAVSPGSGSALGGTEIMLVGTGFTPGDTMEVFVGGLPASGVRAIDGLTLTATTPPGSPGHADVELRNPNGQTMLERAFRYGPVLTGVAPPEGLAAGGTPVTLSGAGFTSSIDTRVHFGSAPATSVTVVDSQTITAVTPPGPAGPSDVVVSNSNGQSALAAAFHYRTPPSLASIEPVFGPTSGGTLVTVRGTGFVDAERTTLRVGGAAATSLVAVDATTIRALTPRGTQGAADVTLETPFGAATLPGAFLFGLAFPLFDAPLDQFLNLGPSDIQAIDVDGDGLLDVVACNELTGPGTIMVYRGRGNGDFALPFVQQVRSGNTSPSSIALGDLDEDGSLDLIVTEAGVSAATIYLGDGAGAFVPGSTVTTGLGPQSARLARLDGDAHLDFLCVNARSGNLTFRRGDGLGGLGPRITIDVPAGPAAGPVDAALADLDGDGDLDLVVANDAIGTLSVARNDGAGNFAFEAADLPVGSSPRAVLAMDLNGDSRFDLACANLADGTVSVILALPDGTWGPATTFAVGSGGPPSRPAALAAGDVDGDGHVDLVSANETTDTVSVLAGDGRGGFGPPATYAVGDRPVALAVADFTGDGRPEIVAANRDSSTFSLLLNRAGTPVSAPRFDLGGDPADCVTADFDRDGEPDVAIAGAAGGSVVVLLGRGDGTFVPGATLSPGGVPGSIAASDLDLDGIVDLVVTVGASDRVVAFLGDGAGGFSPGVVSSLGAHPTAIAIGRFDDDPFPDVAFANLLDQTVSISRNDGTGRFSGEQRFEPGVEPAALAVGDFDLDRRLDIAVVGTTPAFTGALVIVRGDGAGGFLDASFLGTAERLQTVAVADIDGDGRLDVVAAGIDTLGPSSAYALIFLGVGTGNFVLRSLRVGNDPRAARLSDVDADGNLDLVLANRGGANVSVFLGDGTGEFRRGLFSFATGFRPAAIAIADFDRSGSPDLLVVNRGGRSFSLLRSRS
jgi:hypothetical protein